MAVSQKVLVELYTLDVLPLYCFTFMWDILIKGWKTLYNLTVFLRILYFSCPCLIACYRNTYFQTAFPVSPLGPADRVTLFRWQDILCAKVIKCRQKPFLKEINSTSRAVYFPLWEKLNNDVFMGDQRDLMGLCADTVPFQTATISPQEFQGSSNCDFSECPLKSFNWNNYNNLFALRFL